MSWSNSALAESLSAHAKFLQEKKKGKIYAEFLVERSNVYIFGEKN